MQRVHLGAEEVADDAARQAGLPLQQRRRPPDEGLLAVDLLPEREERVDLALEVLLGDALGHRPHDHAARVLGQQLGDHLAQLGPLLAALDLPADADLGGVGHVDQEAAGERDLGGDPAALGADGLLGDLDGEGLALLEDVLDVRHGAPRGDLALAGFAGVGRSLGGRRAADRPATPAAVPAPPPALALALPLFDRGRLGRLGRRRIGLGLLLGLGVLVGILVLVRLEEVGGVQEGALLLADVDERGLNARQHRLDPSEVDVADRAAVVGAVDQQLDQAVVFQDRHAGFPLAPVDQDLALQVMTSATVGAPSTRSRDRSPRHAWEWTSVLQQRADPAGAPGDSRAREAARQHSRQLYVASKLRATQSTTCPRICRAITIRWISLVPSPISQTLASRIIRSTG